MRFTVAHSAKSSSTSFHIVSHLRPFKAYHLRLSTPVSWTYARDLQNSIIKGYQSHHHNPHRRPLPPTFITLRLQPVFTYGRAREERPTQRERRMLEGLPGADGRVAETRMAWHRDRGWQFHGPGQVQCWMVVDLRDWNVYPMVG